jgi:DNA-binding transcriptional MerR regulator
MSKYTTGELAKLCDVSVRTVQFYDTRGLLPPTELTEGGRRLYTDDDLIKLKLICLLKSLGIKLDSIKATLESEKQGKVLNLLLDEQTKHLSIEIEKRQKQLEVIKIIRENIKNSKAIPVNPISGIDDIMKNQKGLRKIRTRLIGFAIPAGIVQYGSILYWIFTGNWLPFVCALPFLVLGATLLVKFHYKNVKYICPECNKIFRPRFWDYFFTNGWKVRKLPCTKCDYKGLCVEVYAGGETE